MSIHPEFRVTPFRPRFEWLPSISDAAVAIDRPHEDCPRRVAATGLELARLTRLRLAQTITNDVTRTVHAAVFADNDFAGRCKETDIFLGPNGKPVVSKGVRPEATTGRRVPRKDRGGRHRKRVVCRLRDDPPVSGWKRPDRRDHRRRLLAPDGTSERLARADAVTVPALPRFIGSPCKSAALRCGPQYGGDRPLH